MHFDSIVSIISSHFLSDELDIVKDVLSKASRL